jgi:beta-lactam-binding protein with PASTA domain
MRFLLGVLLGYSMRGKKRPLITVLTALAFIVYVMVPAIALLALRLDVQRERRMRPTQIQVPTLKGLSYEDAATKLRASNLNIRLLATRSDLPLQPGLVIDQTPQPGEEVSCGYAVGVTTTKADSHGHVGNDTTLTPTAQQSELATKLASASVKSVFDAS